MRMKARATMVALVPALLFAAVGCSSTNTPATGKAPDPKGSAGSASAAPGVPAPSAAAAGSAAPKSGGSRLERSALAQGDLPGYQVSAQGKNPNAPDGQPQADKKACQPLADVMGDKPDPPPARPSAAASDPRSSSGWPSRPPSAPTPRATRRR